MAEEKTTEAATTKFDFKIILIGLVIFLIAMGSCYFLMKSLIAPFLPQEQSQTQELGTGNLVSAGEFITNVNDIGGTRFLKVEVFVEVADKKVQEEITSVMPVIKDSILGILSAKTVADLDVRNRANLKAEIKNNLNSKIGTNKIKNVYFTDFIMQ